MTSVPAVMDGAALTRRGAAAGAEARPDTSPTLICSLVSRRHMT